MYACCLYPILNQAILIVSYRASQVHQKRVPKSQDEVRELIFKGWTKTWPFIIVLPGDIHSFSCTVHSRRVFCQYQGVRDMKDHISSQFIKH